MKTVDLSAFVKFRRPVLEGQPAARDSKACFFKKEKRHLCIL